MGWKTVRVFLALTFRFGVRGVVTCMVQVTAKGALLRWSSRSFTEPRVRRARPSAPLILLRGPLCVAGGSDSEQPRSAVRQEGEVQGGGAAVQEGPGDQREGATAARRPRHVPFLVLRRDP